MTSILKILLAVLAVALCAPTAGLGAVTPQKKPVYELPKTGKNLPRGVGGWINVEMAGARLTVKFFDAEKKPVPPDITNGLVQLRYTGKSSVRAPLSREGEFFVTPNVVRPPHNFLVILTLSSAAEGGENETHAFRYP